MADPPFPHRYATVLTLQTIEASVQAIDRATEFELPRAIELAQAAWSDGIEHPLVLNLLAYQAEEEGRFDVSLGFLDRAAALAPTDVYVWNAVGLCLDKQERRGEAIKAFEHALTLDPGFPQANFNLGRALEQRGDYDEAAAHFGRAIVAAPDYPEAFGGLASIAVRQGDLAAIREHAEHALALDPRQPAARAALANAELIERNFARAEVRLRALRDDPALSDGDRPTVSCLLGDALDGLDRTAEAFAAYTEGKAAFGERARSWQEAPGVESQVELVRRLDDYFSAADDPVWRTAAALAPGEPTVAAGHAFLLGFPRSGTTLLEQLFASHPAMVAVDERATLRDVEDRYLGSREGLDRLAAIRPDEAAQARASYWSHVQDAGIDAEGAIVVDKMPLYTVKEPLIAKLFPGVKLLFALRDPRDVVLSCFRRPFQMNAGMYPFVTLEGAARYYDGVMALAETYRRRLAVPEHVIRYEALVEDPERELRAVCAFLGVAWTAEMLDFADKARVRRIRTPSAAQVRRGLYRGGADQWRRYAAELAPVLPILQPWIERFGYAPS